MRSFQLNVSLSKNYFNSRAWKLGEPVLCETIFRISTDTRTIWVFLSRTGGLSALNVALDTSGSSQKLADR